MVVALVFGAGAMAADLTVNFNTTSPDVTVTAFKPNNMANDWAWQGTATFTLTGTGDAYGTIYSSNNGVFDMYTDVTGQPTVYGGYTAGGSDFSSMFEARSFETDSGYFEMEAWSTHTIDAIGVPDGTMYVSGDAMAVWAGGSSMGDLTEAGQYFIGEAEEVTVFGSKMHSNRQPDDPDPWNMSLVTGADWTATATGSSTVTFEGATDGRTYSQAGDSVDDIWDRRQQQGLGFAIEIGGSSVSGTLNTTYGYTNTLTTSTLIVGDTSTLLTIASGGGRNWDGVPGYLTNP